MSQSAQASSQTTGRKNTARKTTGRFNPQAKATPEKHTGNPAPTANIALVKEKSTTRSLVREARNGQKRQKTDPTAFEDRRISICIEDDSEDIQKNVLTVRVSGRSLLSFPQDCHDSVRLFLFMSSIQC